MKSTTKYFDCICYAERHTVRFRYYDEDIPPDDNLSMSIQFSAIQPWYKRVWYCLRYMFGIEFPDGYWDGSEISPQQQLELIDFIKDRLDSKVKVNSNDKTSI